MLRPYQFINYLSAGLLTLLLMAACSPVSKQPGGKNIKTTSSNESHSVAQIQSSSEFAKDLLASSLTHLEKLNAFRVKIHAIRAEVFPGPLRLHFEQKTTVTVKRPNEVKAASSGDFHGSEFYLYGKTAVLYDPGKHLYSNYTVPGGIDASFNDLVEKHGFSIPLAELIFNDIRGVVTPNIKAARYIGLHNVSGRPCHHLHFKGKRVDWQLWISATGSPLPAKVIISYLSEEGIPEFGATLSDWEEMGDIPDSFFEFKPPADAVKVSGLTNAE